MLQRFLDYGLSMLLGAALGMGVGFFTHDVLGGGAVGLVVGFFIGVGVRAWRTRDTPESFEERGLGD